jgi:deoxycytidylate deaminase
MYVTKAPCLDCAKLLINSGIVKVMCPEPEGRWKDNQFKSIGLMTSAGIEVEFYG